MHLMWKVESNDSIDGLPQFTASRPRVINAAGNTLLLSENSSTADAHLALKSLRGFRATGRRVAWCDATELHATPNSDMKRWGRRFVEDGGAEIVVVNGEGARETALGAREAGAPLSHVVVCPDAATARNLLSDLVGAGDTVLVLGLCEEDCRRLADRLTARSEPYAAEVSAVA